MSSGLGHAATLHDGEKHMQVTHFQPPANLTFPIYFFQH
jgi:hypothetical protein